jgi:hypothetical protein
MALHANSSSASDAQKKLAAEKIVRDAPIQGIDFADPVHAFTVWTEFPSHFMKHCGSRKTFDDAWAWALKHVNQKTLYIVRGPLDAFDITKVEMGTRYPHSSEHCANPATGSAPAFEAGGRF